MTAHGWAYYMLNMPLDWPPEYRKPTFVVPDNMVDAMREYFGDAARVVPISETLLAPPDREGGQ